MTGILSWNAFYYHPHCEEIGSFLFCKINVAFQCMQYFKIFFVDFQRVGKTKAACIYCFWQDEYDFKLTCFDWTEPWNYILIPI